MRLTRSMLATALVIASGSLLSACGKAGVESARTANGLAAAIPVVTAPVVRKPFAFEVEAVGTARANESVDVTSKTSNIIKSIRFEEGDFLRRGDVLVELDDAEAQAALAEARAALADSENQYKRSRELHAQQALSVSQLETIEATLKTARARVDAAEARVADTVIRAAFDGRTGLRRISVGGLVTPATVITTLDDISVIKLDFTVPETSFFMLRKGLPVTAVSAGLPNRTFVGKVTGIDSRIDPITRSVIVRAVIDNKDGALQPGMFMTVTLQGEPTPTLVIPEGAIVPQQGRAFVFVVTDDIAERREVRIGRRRPGEVEIVSGLAEHDVVVVEGTQNIRDGSRVRDDARLTSVLSL